MSMQILFFAGSARKESLNKKLARQAADLAGDLGIQSTFVDLTDYPMPIYNGDDEVAHSLPDKAIELKPGAAENAAG